MTPAQSALTRAVAIHRATMRSYALAWRFEGEKPKAARAVTRAVRARDYAQKCAEVAKEAA